MTAMTRNDNAFAVLLRDLRARAGKSMGEVARAVGVTPMYYSEIENAKKPPPPEGGKFDFTKLADTVGGDVEALLQSAAASREYLDIRQAPEEARNVVAMLARRAADGSVTAEQLATIKKAMGVE